MAASDESAHPHVAQAKAVAGAKAAQHSASARAVARWFEFME